ncbi:MAG: tRNA dihydrouridine synthase DusB [Ruminococcaceae bacterium]|nr:tRNA dihydrouridine synthase DusB [Oscillospiraceae bacterium]
MTNQTNTHAIPAALAPMAGFTDSVFRKICTELGAKYTVSEMISAVAMTMGDSKTAELAKITEGEAPVVLQIFGHDPAIMARAADMLLSGNYKGCSYAALPAGIDINMGCPVKKIVTSGDGSALMKNIALAREITARVAEACAKYNTPLSVKFRLGWDENSIIAPQFAAEIAAAGAQKITLHTRTREQMYAPSADPDQTRIVAKALANSGNGHVILVGNGDIESYADARKYIDNGCSEVSVGRGALGDPWIFSALSDPENFIPPTTAERKALVIRFVEEVVELKGEVVGIRESRGRAAHFIKGMRGSAKIRDRLNHANTLSEFVSVLGDIE